MASIGDIFSNGLKGNIIAGLAIGVGVAVLAPVVVPILAGIAKPLAKGAVKGGILVYEKGKEVYGEVTEAVEDLTAEARSELSEPHKEAAPAAARGKRA